MTASTANGTKLSTVMARNTDTANNQVTMTHSKWARQHSLPDLRHSPIVGLQLRDWREPDTARVLTSGSLQDGLGLDCDLGRHREPAGIAVQPDPYARP